MIHLVLLWSLVVLPGTVNFSEKVDSGITPVVIQLKSGEILEGHPIHADHNQFTLTSAGQNITLSWEDVTPQSVYQVQVAFIADDDPQSFFELGLYCLSKGLRVPAATMLHTAEQVDPHTYGARVSLYQDQLAQMTRQEAIELMNSGVGSYTLGDYESALDLFLESLQLYDKDAVAHYNLGLTYLKLEQPNQALTSFVNALKNNPKHTLAQLSLGEMQLDQHQLDEAVTTYQQILVYKPENYTALIRLAEIYFHQKKYQPALEKLNQVILKYPRKRAAYVWRASIYLVHQKLVEAEADLRTAWTIAPYDLIWQQKLQQVSTLAKGPDWGDDRLDLRTKHYSISANGSEKYLNKVGHYLELLYQEFDLFFQTTFGVQRGSDDTRIARVLVFRTETEYRQFLHDLYATYTSYMETAASYFPEFMLIVFYHNRKTGIESLFHEACHHYLDYFVPNPPVWFKEGLATVFETAYYSSREDRIVTSNFHKQRLKNFRKMIRNDLVKSFPEFMMLSTDDFHHCPTGGPECNYDQAWAMFVFFLQYREGVYLPLLKDYFHGLLRGEAQQEVLERVFAEVDLSLLERECSRWFLTL